MTTLTLPSYAQTYYADVEISTNPATELLGD
jgi:hypothetical protein